MNILRKSALAAILMTAGLTLAGCPSGAIPGVPGLGSPSPAASTPTTGGSTAPSTSACTKDSPAATPTTGNASQGAYNGQRLPNGYDTYNSEADVTAAIKKEDGGANWACFQKFYPGATTVYMGKK